MADENKSKDVLVHADHVKVYFKGKDKKSGTVRAVDDISFDIFAGETFGVVGESGCGKSTLGRTLIRLIPATDGHVYLDGEDISGLKGKALKQMRKKAQIIFQDPSACLNPRRTVRQILMEPFQIHHMTGSMDVDARIEELLHLVGLDTYHLSRYPHELSGGQKQRIGIARALALEPKLIICDEAVSALDVSVQAQVLNLLQELKERLGLTYFFISHNLNVVYQVSDRVGVMYLGKMVEIAAYDQLYEKRYHPYTEALLSAIPQVDADDRTERIHLTGEVPSPSDPPSGCPFHTRCPKACDICSKEITIVGSWVYTLRDYVTTFDFLKRANAIGLPMSELITDKFPLEQINEALQTNLAMTGLRSFMFKNVYTNKTAKSEEEKADRMLRTLYLYYRDNIDKLPKMYIDIINRDEEPKIERAICDYISGMSDTYSINTFRKIYIPMSWDI